MRHPSCQPVVSAMENSDSRERSWVFGWEGPADAVCVVVMYRWGCRDGHGAVPVEGSGAPILLPEHRQPHLLVPGDQTLKRRNRSFNSVGW